MRNLYNKNKTNKGKENLLIIKAFLIIIGTIMNEYILKLNMFIWLKDEFSQMKGIKLYSIFKIVEYILLLFNKFGYDLDIQIIKIISAKKTKHKIFSFLILLIFIFLNIYVLNIFYFCTWLIINDNEKSFFLIYLKVNFIEFKQANKAFKSIHNFLASDIYDRFLNFFILIFIIINGLIENKIKINFGNIYFKRICLYFFSELISDYLKGIIVFKINNLNPKNIKAFLKEETQFYQELDNINKKDENKNKYIHLKDIKFIETYTTFINKENLICILLNINIFPFIIILMTELFFKYKLLSFFTIAKIFILVIIKHTLEKIIKLFNSKFNNKNIKEENQVINSLNEDKIKDD